MGKGEKKEGNKSVRKGDYYDIKNGMLERKRKKCPKCGEGRFLAQHKDRESCGKCGYTVFKNAGEQ